MAFDPIKQRSSGAARLSPRERQVLGVLVTGESREGAAEKLHISEHTVRFHVRQVMKKTNARTLLEAVFRLGALSL